MQAALEDEKKNIIITTEADAQGTLAHRRMVQTTSSTVSELHTASGATDDEAAFNPVVRGADTAAPRAPDGLQ